MSAIFDVLAYQGFFLRNNNVVLFRRFPGLKPFFSNIQYRSAAFDNFTTT
jgi:hypothetical protein